MKKLDFEQMESIAGGSCFRQGIVAYVSLFATFASIGVPVLVIAGAGLTASAYYDYYNCISKANPAITTTISTNSTTSTLTR